MCRGWQTQVMCCSAGSGADVPGQCLGSFGRWAGSAEASSAGLQRAEPAHWVLPEHELPGRGLAAGAGPFRGKGLLGARLPHR